MNLSVTNLWRCTLCVAPILLCLSLLLLSTRAGNGSEAAYGLAMRPEAKAFLQMPAHADGPIPRMLSATGAFVDTASLRPMAALIPYDLIVPFWSDGAEKSRWFSVPDGQKIKFSPTSEWSFPPGTVFVKTFSLATNESDSHSMRRLETRLLVCDDAGGVYGVTYKWRPDGS